MSNAFEGLPDLTKEQVAQLGDEKLRSIRRLLDPNHSYSEIQPLQWKTGAFTIPGTICIPIASQKTRYMRNWGLLYVASRPLFTRERERSR